MKDIYTVVIVSNFASEPEDISTCSFECYGDALEYAVKEIRLVDDEDPKIIRDELNENMYYETDDMRFYIEESKFKPMY